MTPSGLFIHMWFPDNVASSRVEPAIGDHGWLCLVHDDTDNHL